MNPKIWPGTKFTNWAWHQIWPDTKIQNSQNSPADEKFIKEKEK